MYRDREWTTAGVAAFNKRMEPVVQRMIPIGLPNIEIKILRYFDLLHGDSDTWNNVVDQYLIDFDPRTRLHQHNWYEFTFISSGRVEYFTNNQKISLGPGDIFMMPPGVRHGWIPQSEPLVLSGFHLKIQAVNALGDLVIKKLNAEIEKQNYSLPNDDSLCHIMNEIYGCMDQPNELTDYTARSLLKLFIYRAFDKYYAKAFKNTIDTGCDHEARNKMIVDQIEDIILDNLNQNLSLEEIASHFSYSFRQLNRIFSNLKGQSIGKFMIETKIDMAKKRLQSGGMMIKNIALDLGYQDSAYFSRLFKKYTGETPEKYRQKSTALIS